MHCVHLCSQGRLQWGLGCRCHQLRQLLTGGGSRHCRCHQRVGQHKSEGQLRRRQPPALGNVHVSLYCLRHIGLGAVPRFCLSVPPPELVQSAEGTGGESREACQGSRTCCVLDSAVACRLATAKIDGSALKCALKHTQACVASRVTRAHLASGGPPPGCRYLPVRRPMARGE